MSLSALVSSEKTSSWQTLLTLDRKSDDFTHLARGLLSDQKTRKSEQFTEEEAVNLIDLIDQTILQHTDITKELKSTAFTVLRRLCGTFGRLPTSCSIDVDFKTEDLPFATRGYTDLWKRDLNGGKVAVKALRFGPDDDRSMITKRFCKEILLWKILNHPNILPFYGISMNPKQFCMVSPWMENGNVLSYTRRNPEANRLRLLIDVASGLKYLHRASLVHGNIRGSNILISDSQPPQALLADFGLNTIIFDPFSFTKASINWTAPELLTPDNSTHEPSISSDTYALAMVIYEVLTGTPPLAGRGKTELACKVALEDERPRRPRDSEKLGFTDKVWEVLQKCWEKKPSARPSVDIVSSCLKQAADTWAVDVPAFLLSSKPKVEQARNTEDQAKDFANQLDETLDQIGISEDLGKTYLKYLQKLCGAYGVLPASLMLTDGFDKIEPRPFASGRFAHVYKATYNGQPVVAKALKTASVDDLEDVHKRFAKQVVGWKWLRHENILPFVGVASLPPPFSIVSVRVENGDIASFMRANPDQNPFTLLVDVTNGLQYLHEHDFVHGNLRGANILINSENRACLADFGLFAIIEETTSIEPEATGITRGSMVRWTAPEILNPEMYSGRGERACKKPPSKSTDIYALGMTIFEVVSGRRPFEHTNLDVEVIQKVLSGARPEKPSVGFSDALWTLLTHTWVEVFETADLASSVRPDITEVLGLLQDEAEDWSRTRGPLDFPSPTEQTPSAADSTDSLGFADQLVGPARRRSCGCST
ncbi:kinase-like domain-containing protein [Thelephora terrestris]|uniref:Kinase-like domain-containing protein n=1 Tax=Thelephora terrestris TaxID=56493 RepID=A0A9P6L3H1_9AGAM|nr:kinase-like domain-containing protein [Thelephora terrestris]